jgi:hypothetical protein
MNPPIKLLEYLQTPAGEMLDVVHNETIELPGEEEAAVAAQ